MKRIITIIICLLTLCGITTAQDIYAVVVGIPNYQYINSLVLPGKDAKAVAEYYKQKNNYVITLTGKYATKAAVTKSLSDQFSRAKEGDAAVFYFSGHGYEGGLCPYDINANDPNSGLSYSEIQQIFRNCKAKRKIVFADACFSGGLTGKFASSSRNGLEILLFSPLATAKHLWNCPLWQTECSPPISCAVSGATPTATETALLPHENFSTTSARALFTRQTKNSTP